MFSSEGRFVESRGAQHDQMNIPEEGVSRNTKGRLSMEELSMVFKDRLIESTYVNGLIVDYDGQGRAHRIRENMITKDHIKGSRRGHEKLSQDRLDRRLAEIEVQLEVMEGLLQKNGEDQRYGWILPKKVKWYML